MEWHEVYKTMNKLQRGRAGFEDEVVEFQPKSKVRVRGGNRTDYMLLYLHGKNWQDETSQS